MHKILLSLFVIAFVLLRAGESSVKSEKVVLQAENISGDKEYLYAKGHIVLEYSETLFLADSARYDKSAKVLYIDGNVKITNPDDSVVKTDKITLIVEEKKVLFKRFFYSGEDEVWLSSKQAQKQKECYKLKDAILSSCIVGDPDWHLGFSEAKYNAKTKYIKLKDIKFFVGDTPIFYFPYLAFSTSRERSSGLLMPKIGYNSKDGFLYEQPYYWAVSHSMDVEFNPQIRTDRSLGIYSTVRFADSNFSEGSVRLGYFIDSDDYVQEHNLKNSEHYGIETIYKSDNILGKNRPQGYSDALYANLLLFNDIDYLNLQKSTLNHLSDSHLKESRVNYMLFDDSYYFGLNARYFLDAKKDTNRDTLQELPSVSWHKFSEPIAMDGLAYSVDMSMHNYTRSRGATARQLELSLPVEYHFSLFDDYLKVNLREEIYAHASYFDKSHTDNYKGISATHKVKLFSDLLKSYDSGMHTVGYSLEYAKQSHAGDSIYKYHILDTNLIRDFLPHKPFDDKLTLALNQYWYSNSMSLGAKQRISQIYYPDRDEKWGDLRHELELDYNNWSIKNLLEYSFEYQNFSELSNKIKYSDSKFYLGIEHFWRKDLQQNTILTNEIAFDAKYKYSKELKLFGGMTYDLEKSHSKKWKSGFMYNRGCWSVEFTYAHDTKPILEKNGGGSIDSNTFLVKINLVPLGESEISQ